MSGTRAISAAIKSSLPPPLHGKAPKEIYAILTEILACFLPGRAKDLSVSLYNDLARESWKEIIVLRGIFAQKCPTRWYRHISGLFIHSLVFSPRGWSGRNQSPVMEPMWFLAHCILGKFLGIVCHCFSPPLDVPTFAATCLCILSDARDPSSERWKGYPLVILPKFRLPRKFRDLLHAENLRHGTDGFTSPPKEGVLRIFSP